MRNEAVFLALDRLRADGRAGVLATVTRVQGSSPGALGSSMLVSPGVEPVGTVGGGCVDGQVWAEMPRVLEAGQPRALVVDLSETDDPEHGLICGGRVTVFLRPVTPGAPAPVDDALAALRARGEQGALVTVVEGALAGARALLPAVGADVGSTGDPRADAAARAAVQAVVRSETPALVEVAPGLSVFVEPVTTPTLVICGSGHIAFALARLAAAIDFSVVVLDDREQFLNAARFPGARLLLGPFEETLATYAAPPGSFVAVVTRGHRHDQVCLEWALRQDARYVGLVGSRAKIRKILLRAREAGHDERRLERVRSPIGLDVGAVTVEEIAVAIAAELVAVRRRGPEVSRDLRVPGAVDPRQRALPPATRLPPRRGPDGAPLEPERGHDDPEPRTARTS